MNRNELVSVSRPPSAAALALKVFFAAISLVTFSAAAEAAESITIESRTSFVSVGGSAFSETLGPDNILETFHLIDPPGIPPMPNGLDPFISTVDGSANATGGGVSAGASQNSFLTFDTVGNLLTFEGSSSAHADVFQPALIPAVTPVGRSEGQATSFAQLLFSINRAGYRYRITESDTSDSPNAQFGGDINRATGGVTISGPSPGGDTFPVMDSLALGGETTGSAEGELVPGRYRWQAVVNNFGGAQRATNAINRVNSGTLNWQLELIPPIVWADAVNGNFTDGTKWSAGHPPTADDNATVDVPGLYTITLDTDVTHKKLHVNGAGVFPTLDLDGHTYTLDEINIGGQDGDDVTFTFDDSSLGEPVVSAAAAAFTTDDGFAQATSNLNPTDVKLVTARLRADNGATARFVDVPTLANSVEVVDNGVVIVKGNGRLYVTDHVVVGSSPVDSRPMAGLSIEQGAGFGNTQGVSVVAAPDTGSLARVTIKDPDSLWQTESLIIGKKGIAIQEVLNGATLKSSDIVIGAEAGSNGMLIVNNGALSVADELFVGAEGSGTLNVIGQVTAQHVAIGVGSTGSGHVTVTDEGSSFGQLKVNGFLSVGTLGTGQLLINGGLGVRREGPGPFDTTINSSSAIEVRAGSFTERRLLNVNGVLVINPVDGAATVGPNVSPNFGQLTVGAGGTLRGNGVIFGNVNVPFAGTVAPGFSPGTLTIEGNYEQSGGVLDIEIAGTAPGKFDVLEVTGDVSLGGDLLIAFIDGFAPQQGDVFKFLDVDGALGGAFANIEVRGLLPGFQFDLRPDAGGLAMIALSDGVAVPEPSAIVMLLINFFGLLFRQSARIAPSRAQ